MNTNANSKSPKIKYLDVKVYEALPADLREGYAPRPVKAPKAPVVNPDKEWIESAEFRTTKDAREAALSLPAAAGRCAVLSGSTVADRKLAASLGCREALEAVATVAAVVPTKKGHKVVTGRSALIVGAALARLEALKAQGVRRDSAEYRATVQELRQAA